MKKSIWSPHYEILRKKLLEMRKEAGLTQRDLAQLMQREHSFVWRIEKGERRLDVVEFFWVCEAMGFDAGKVYNEMISEFPH